MSLGVTQRLTIFLGRGPVQDHRLDMIGHT
jgi:hypothetical protein